MSKHRNSEELFWLVTLVIITAGLLVFDATMLCFSVVMYKMLCGVDFPVWGMFALMLIVQIILTVYAVRK